MEGRTKDPFHKRARRALHKEYGAIGKQRVHPDVAWFLISILFLGVAAIVYVVSQTIGFEESTAALAVNLTPTTTLTAETSNNTSAANTFVGCEVSTVTAGQCVNNGDLKASNVSRVNLHTLLPSHPETKIYMSYTPYWGSTSHPNIGYSVADPAYVAKMISSLTTQGYDGLIVDWYGVGSWEDNAMKVLKPAIDKQTKLTYSLMIDTGAIKSHSCYPATCSATQALLNTIAYARSSGYFSDAHYQNLGAQHLVHEFGLEAYPIDWATIRAANPDLGFIFENQAAFTNGNDVGAFGWPEPKIYTAEPAGYEALDYLTNYYATASLHPTKYLVGSVWKGFDDTVASWSSAPFNVAGVNGGRRLEQNCGQDWLNTWATSNAYAGRLDAIEVATWSDYEEGTEAESGISNCGGISASITGKTLAWTISGAQSTLDHFEVFISVDGQNLAVLANNISASTRTLLLTDYNVPNGAYKLYVKAIGKPNIVNHMSNVVAYTASGATPPPPTPAPPGACTDPTFLGASLSPISVAKGGAYTVTCNFGFTGSGIAVKEGSGSCTFQSFVGNVAHFNCVAGTVAGTFQNACEVDAGNTKNLCTASFPIAPLKVL